ncbi:MAG TPA: hypothetical protein VFA27_07225 [Vicinamibacterales bacterium]|nr:hypothetical protein [Vicinamibacterales bacterium]
MKTLNDLLRSADPLRDAAPTPDDRERVRRATIAAAARTAPRAGGLGRRGVLAAGAAALVGLALVGGKAWLGSTTVHAAAVRFEIRLAESTPTLDLQPVRVGPERTIYLHRDAIVTNDDIVDARVVPAKTPGQFNIGVRFTPAAGEKLRAATADHIGRPVALMIDGEVVMAPTLRSAFGADALVTGNYTKDEADRIANGMLLR